jgi:hypothetical protein
MAVVNRLTTGAAIRDDEFDGECVENVDEFVEKFVI